MKTEQVKSKFTFNELDETPIRKGDMVLTTYVTDLHMGLTVAQVIEDVQTNSIGPIEIMVELPQFKNGDVFITKLKKFCMKGQNAAFTLKKALFDAEDLVHA